MQHSRKGEFYGQTNNTLHLDGITLTDTEYTLDKVDWHYHENAYFTFILQGNVTEGNRKEIYECPAGTLLFHNWQDPHYNIKPEGFTRGFHAEIEKGWFDHLDFDASQSQGSLNIANPSLKLLMYQIFRETKIGDTEMGLSIQTLLLQTLSQLFYEDGRSMAKKPLWATAIRDLLHDCFADRLTLDDLSHQLGIHPVHLSRDFPKYFRCSLGDYIRRLRVAKALSLMANPKTDLTEIAFACGFADQSHFTRCFRERIGVTPSAYRKIIFGC